MASTISAPIRSSRWPKPTRPAPGCTWSGIDLNEVVKTRPLVLELTNAVRGYGGRYFDATSAAQLQSASVSIDSLEKGALVQTRYVRNRPVFHYFAIPAVVLIAIVFAVRSVPSFIDVT